MAIWKPDLNAQSGPKYLNIVDALVNDIRSGVLPPGARLPPYRELAHQLGVSPNTTNRAYNEGVERGLLKGEVGRGTFVRGLSPEPTFVASTDMKRQAGGLIDFAHNLPSPGEAAHHLSETLATLARSTPLQPFMDYQLAGDLNHHADAAIAWLARADVVAEAEEVVITSGAQHGILTAMIAVTRPGDLVLTENLTYAPVKAMAGDLGRRTAAIDMDSEGLCPDALEKMCEGRAARALYLSSTLQTPTTITLSAQRRARIAEIARRHDLVLIEDDVFGQLKPDSPPPIATLAPERTVYITTTSKCMSPGLRVGFLRAPSPHAAAIRRAVSLTCWMTPPLMVEIAARWIFDGTADYLTAAQQAEARARQGIARDVLGAQNFTADPQGFHLWLRMPPQWSANAFRAEADRRGVKVAEGVTFAASASATPNAVRLCLAHEPQRARVVRGLGVIKEILDAQGRNVSLII